MSRRSVLASGLGLLLAPSVRAQVAGPRLVVVFANGGWDVSYVFDPKPGVGTVEGPEVDVDPLDPDDVEEVRSFGDLRIGVNASRRPRVTSFFERWASRCLVVNGIAVGTVGHSLARGRILTGTAGKVDAPDLVHVVGSDSRNGAGAGSVDLAGFSMPAALAPTSVQIGARSQLEVLLDLGIDLPRPAASPPSRWMPDAADLAALDAHHRARLGAWQAERAMGLDRSASRLADLETAIDGAEWLRERKDAFTRILDSGVEPTAETQVDLAVELLANDLCRAVLLDTTEDWDTHQDTVSQHGMYDRAFSGLDGLLASLDAAGLLANTVVAVISEMTRTPTRNPQGGKDHWPHTSAMLLGGGVVGGRTVGASDDWLQAVPVDLDTGAPDPAGEPLTYAAFVAGLLELCDVEPGPWLPGVRPWRAARP